MDVNSVKLRPTRDHIRSKARFKHERDFRSLIVCSECNYMKGDQTIDEFVASIRLRNDFFEEALRLNRERLVHMNYLVHAGLK